MDYTGFNQEQKEQLATGIEHGVDVSLYADPRLDHTQMSVIREWLEYAKEYNIKCSVDIRKYINPDISAYKLYKIFLWIRLCQSSSSADLKEDISEYVDIETIVNLTDEQFYHVFDGIAKGLDVSWYARPEFTPLQMSEIKKGLEEGIDVSWYARPEFNSQQMRQIRLGLQQNLDVSIYADPKFDELQMEQIRVGLLYNIDVSQYANPDIDWREMGHIRRMLPSQSESTEQKKETKSKKTYHMPRGR